MDNIISVLKWIFFGDFGLLTLTPRYLFLVLFPIMTLLEVIGQILPKIPFLRKTSPLINEFFYSFIGLGCTTVAVVSLNYIKDRSMRRRMIWILILLVPCSSQLAIIATFAAMVSFRVFVVYLIFCFIFVIGLRFIISKIYPLNTGMVKPVAENDERDNTDIRPDSRGGWRNNTVADRKRRADYADSSKAVTAADRKRRANYDGGSTAVTVADRKRRADYRVSRESRPALLPQLGHALRILASCIKNALRQVYDTALPFCAGSIIISLASCFGLLDRVCALCGPFMESVFGLPPAAAGLLVLNVLKRDFGSASLLSGAGEFDAVQMIVTLILMTFSVPCFNSTVLIIKQQKLPNAIFFWLGSLIISLLFGCIVSRILSVCFV